MLPISDNKFNSLSQIINIDYNRGIIEYKSKDNNIKKLNIKELVNKSSNNKDEKNKESNLPIIQTNASMKNLKDTKYLNTNQMNSTFFLKPGKKIKLKLLNINVNNNININDIKNINNNNTINVIQIKKKNLLKQNEKNDSLIKFLDLLIKKLEKDPNYFYNDNNIMNLVNNMNYKILKGEELCFIAKKAHKNLGNLPSELKTKILLLEKKFLNALNSRLQVKLTGDEKKLNLSGKRIKNVDLELLFTLYSTGLEELDLSNSYIKNIDEIKYWNASDLRKLNLSNKKIKDINSLKDISIPKCKFIDLSFNKIENIIPLGELMKNNKEFEILKINNNRVKDGEALKLNLSKNIKDIILENNKILLKDIQEIKKLILLLNKKAEININNKIKNKDNEEKEKIFIIYKKNDNDNGMIKLFNTKFIEKNKEKCKIIINGKKYELIE